ncbi:DNA-binding protein RFX6-like [Liolophura sinensis]|uniref:DNA-binding protein RFX6-like n=1 Tax=Liolophura sinensis TaxID=3198878 RepID=UPI0031583183
MDMLPLTPMLAEGMFDTAGHHTGFSYCNSHQTPGYWSEARGLSNPDSRDPGKSEKRENVTNPRGGEDAKGKDSITEAQCTDHDPEDIEQDCHGAAADLNTQKQSQVASTLNWLSDNYERAEGVCLPRCVLYTHYLDFCKKHQFTPAGAATFGKIIRQRFPKLTTRRLGTRGQSKYHYYGIGIKETSIYYHSVYSGKGLTRFSGTKIKTEGSSRKYSLSSKTGTLLPEFPEANNLFLPKGMDKEKFETFIMMYRTHCQRILDTVISANFEEVQNFLLHFWQGMPEHLLELMGASLVTDLVGLCDSVLYKVLIDVLIPSTIQDIPDSLSTEIKCFIRRLPMWIDNALETIPDPLRIKKMEVVRWFVKMTRRQMAFVHLAQTARSVLLNQETVSQMIEDISAVDFTGLCCQAGFTQFQHTVTHQKLVVQYFHEFRTLLSKQASVECYSEWVDTMVDRCVLKPCEDRTKSFQDKAAEFLLQWAVYNSFIMRDLTLLSASSFGSFHLIHMMLDEYVFLVMETQLHQLKEAELLQAVQRQMKQAGEINMKAKVRLQPSKLQNSPKSRKRKIEDHFESDDEAGSASPDENHAQVSGSRPCIQTSGTAFSRPIIPGDRQSMASSFPEDSNRGVMHHNHVSFSPVKLANPSSSERGHYFPSFGLNSYEFVSPNNSFSSTRVPALADSHHVHSQGFGAVSFGGAMAPVTGPYWTESRQHPSLGDPYNAYTYNKFSPSYENYNKPSLIRNSSYGDALNRSAFESSRGCYSRPHDSFQVSTPLSVGGYSTNFMDIAPPSGQYGRQDPVLFQDEIFPNNIGAISAFNKSYLTASFR